MARLRKFIAIILFLCLFPALIYAQDASPTPVGNVVLVESAFVRSGPSDAFLPVGALYQGDSVTPLNISEDGLWILIPYSRGNGWIQRNLVRWENEGALNQLPVMAANITPTPRIQVTNTPFVPTSTPDGDYVNPNNARSAYVRAGPGRGYLRLGQLLSGEIVEAVGRNADTTWIMIRYQLNPFQTGFAWLGRDLVTWQDPESLEDLPVVSLDNLTPTVTFTASPSPTNTGTVEAATATLTATPSATASITSTATNLPTETATATASHTPTDLPSETPTDLPSHTPTDLPTATETATTAATATDLPTATASLTNTATDLPTETETATETPDLPSETPTATEAPTETEIAQVAVVPSDTASPSPSETPTETVAASEIASPTIAATDIFAVQATSVANNPTEAPSPSPIIEEVSESPSFSLPLEAIVGAVLLLLVLVYIWFYMQGLAAANRYQKGFIIDTCPVCKRGHLHLEERPARLLGIPISRRTVRCDECRSVLRETGSRRWRYAVDRIENPALYERFNGREIQDEDLERIAKGLPQNNNKPRSKPEFLDEESES